MRTLLPVLALAWTDAVGIAAAVAFVALVIAFCCYLARGLRSEQDVDPGINEVLVVGAISERAMRRAGTDVLAFPG